MKPAWDKLMAKYEGHATALVGDVDCTAAGKPLCEEIGVEGFPTIKWGDPAALEAYEGGRDFDSLVKFAEENLKPMCSPKNIDLCDDEKKAQIKKLQAMSEADLQKAVDEKEEETKEAGKTFESEVEKLQKRYEELDKEKTEKIAAIKDSGLGLMKAVLAAGKSKEEL